MIAAEKANVKIAVEVKSFLEYSSAISGFHMALGQFINYRGALRKEDPNRLLYLAVPLTTYNTFFQLDFPQWIMQENQVKLVVYEPESEAIVKWRK